MPSSNFIMFGKHSLAFSVYTTLEFNSSLSLLQTKEREITCSAFQSIPSLINTKYLNFEDKREKKKKMNEKIVVEFLAVYIVIMKVTVASVVCSLLLGNMDRIKFKQRKKNEVTFCMIGNSFCPKIRLQHNINGRESR